MTASSLMSRSNNIKGMSRMAPSTAEGDDDRAVQEYKKCMYDIQREHPDLPTGAVQQMALERCQKMNEERGGCQREKRPSVLRGMMSKLRIGKNNGRGSRGDGFGDDEDDLNFGTLLSEPDAIPRKAQRSLAVRQSVTSISSTDRKVIMSDQSGSSVSDSDHDAGSLQDSLDDIEKSCNPQPRRGSKHNLSSGRGLNRRISNLSLELSDVEEDDKSETSDLSAEDGVKFDQKLSSSWRGKSAASKSWKGKSTESSSRNNNQFEMSVSDVLPDEIKLALNSYKPGKNAGPGRRAPASSKISQGSVRRSQTSEVSGDQSKNEESFGSSFLSVDSANFQGDFSAWSSMRRRNS